MNTKTNWGYIVAENTLNEVTIPREKDQLELNVAKMHVETNVDNPTLMGKDIATKLIKDLVKATASGAHKHIIGTVNVPDVASIQHLINEYNSGHDIHLKDGTLYNTAIATPGDIIYFMNPAHKFATEEVMVDASKHMFPLTTGNILLTKVQGILDHATTDGKTIGTSTEKLVTEGETTRLNSLIDTNTHNLATVQTLAGQNHSAIASIGGNTSNLATDINKNKKDINDLTTKVATNELGVEDYFNSKASFLTDEDVTHHVKNLGDHSKPVKAGKDYTWTITPAMVANFVSPKVVQIKVQDSNGSRYFKDSFNDGNPTVVKVGHRSYTTTLTDTSLLVHTDEDLSNCELVYLETEGGTSSLAKDQVARDAAAKAQSDANKAAASAASNTALIQINSTGINDKQDKVLSAAYPGSSKGVEAAMTNIYNIATTNTNNMNTLNGVDVKTSTGVIDLDQMDTTGAGANEDKLLVTVKEVKAMIQSALSTAMHVTFDDKTTDDYKIGK